MERIKLRLKNIDCDEEKDTEQRRAGGVEHFVGRYTTCTIIIPSFFILGAPVHDMV